MPTISHSPNPFIYGGKKKKKPHKNLTSWRNERCHKGCESFHGTLPSNGINNQIWSQIDCIWRDKSLPQFLQEAKNFLLRVGLLFYNILPIHFTLYPNDSKCCIITKSVINSLKELKVKSCGIKIMTYYFFFEYSLNSFLYFICQHSYNVNLRESLARFYDGFKV